MKKDYLLVTMDYNGKKALVTCKNDNKEIFDIMHQLETMTDCTVFLCEAYGTFDTSKEKALIKKLKAQACFTYQNDVNKLFNSLYELLF